MGERVHEIAGHFYNDSYLAKIFKELETKAAIVHAGLDEFSEAEKFAFHIINDVPRFRIPLPEKTDEQPNQIWGSTRLNLINSDIDVYCSISTVMGIHIS